ncbi:phosphoglycerate mutase-like protein, partial [Fistulina hepatica ATCC 64428]
QVRALGSSFSDTPFAAIVASPLVRALATAEVVRDLQQTVPDLAASTVESPSPGIVVSPLLREQHFGSAEGRSFVFRADDGRAQLDGSNSRSQRFPGGESLAEVAQRAEKALDDILLPLLDRQYGHSSGKSANRTSSAPCQDRHIAVVSHGIFIRELVTAFLRRDTTGRVHPHVHCALGNTGWMRVRVEKVEGSLRVDVTEYNRREHLAAVTRQRGGIGSSAHDPKQKDIRDFFTRKN